jgi:hypothetical protein
MSYRLLAPGRRFPAACERDLDRAVSQHDLGAELLCCLRDTELRRECAVSADATNKQAQGMSAIVQPFLMLCNPR